MSRQHFCFGSCCNNVSCIVRIFVATQKVYRDRVLSQLNLISCCSFILMLRHGLFVLLMFAAATKFVMSRQDFFVFILFLCRDLVCYIATQFVLSRPVCSIVTRLLFLVLESLSRHRKVYRNLVYMCLVYLCVMTLRSLSRHRNISSS